MAPMTWLLLLAVSASAQTLSVRPGAALEVRVLAPAAGEAPIAPLFGLVPALTPSLSVPVLSPAPALHAVSVPAASAPQKPGTPKAAEALRKNAADFARLVDDLTGGDAAKSADAAAALLKLKDEHLNPSPDPKKSRILDLKPMQIPAGMLEVQDKARELRDMKSKESDAWLKERSVPFIEDYKGRKRPVDHHHEARAAWEADLDDAYTHRYFDDEMHGLVKALPREQFYAVARAMGLFYDRDQFGAGPHDPNHLPEDVRSLADDPFRSVAWQVRKRGGYDKTATPFAEFQWANFFRARVKTYPTRADFEAAVVEALALAHSPAAKGLPGWKPAKG